MKCGICNGIDELKEARFILGDLGKEIMVREVRPTLIRSPKLETKVLLT